MSEYCKNCFELAKKLTKKERECNTLKNQLDFAIQQKERFEQECEALKSEGFTRESLITEQENEIDELRQECEELKAYAQRQENQRETYYKEFLKLSQEHKELEEEIKELKDYIKWIMSLQ